MTFMKKLILYGGMILLLMCNIVNAVDLNCSTLPSDIDIQMDSEPYLSSTMSFLAVLPDAYKTDSVRCWSYVRSMNGNYQQTNPQKQEYSKTFFSTAKKQESREYFTAQNGVVNAYFTNKNLVSYTEFVIGMRCVSTTSGDTIIVESCFTPYYDDMRRVSARSVWAVRNMDMLVFIVPCGLLVFLIVLWAVKKTRRSLR